MRKEFCLQRPRRHSRAVREQRHAQSCVHKVNQRIVQTTDLLPCDHRSHQGRRPSGAGNCHPALAAVRAPPAPCTGRRSTGGGSSPPAARNNPYAPETGNARHFLRLPGGVSTSRPPHRYSTKIRRRAHVDDVMKSLLWRPRVATICSRLIRPNHSLFRHRRTNRVHHQVVHAIHRRLERQCCGGAG